LLLRVEAREAVGEGVGDPELDASHRHSTFLLFM
jgi:hypothetical protein